VSVYFIVSLELKKKFSDGSRRFEFEWVISGQGKSQIFKTFSDGSELFEFEGRDNKVNEHGKYLCLRIFNNPYPRQIRVRGAEFSCPRGVRGPRVRADARGSARTQLPSAVLPLVWDPVLQKYVIAIDF